MEVIGYIVLNFLALIILLSLVSYIVERFYVFKAGDNPYTRICTKCGAHQQMFQSNIEGSSHITWWEEVYPISNNPKCICHFFSDKRHG